MEKNCFITITGLNHYYDKKPFEIDRILKIVKEPENEYDGEAIRVELPYIGTMGYVANSPNTVFKGTISSGRLYEHIGEYAYAQVYFITHSSVIALVLLPDKIEKDLKEEEIQKMVKKLNTMI
ncbi:HIRAN domain-containing protein [Clostridium sp. JNZ X4-2]